MNIDNGWMITLTGDVDRFTVFYGSKEDAIKRAEKIYINQKPWYDSWEVESLADWLTSRLDEKET